MRHDLRRNVAIAAALFFVVLWAATSGPTRIWHEPDPEAPDVPATFVVDAPTGSLPPPTVVVQDVEERDGSDTAWEIMQTILLAVLFVMIIAAGYVLRGFVTRFSRPDDDEDDRFPVLPDVSTAMAEDAEAQFTALATDSPRNAIVACWIRLEEAVASAGLRPRPADTPAELTARVLATYSVGRAAIDELADLYREARFSTHELGEEQRSRAVDALRRLHADLAPRRAEAVAT